ncbi:MAG: hypothetical protein LC641_09855 [Spirochaeta sp.]|nr:hypothetical protein [Spirochaeta sp.]
MQFPIDTSDYQRISLAPNFAALTLDLKRQLQTNIDIMRDTIVFLTAVAGKKGLGGHSGGPYDIVPEYALSAFNGRMPFEKLLHYREAGEGLYGHPERDPKLGIDFSSGRLGHVWPMANGIARANSSQRVFVFGSDGSQQEGNDAEAARLAVALGLNVKLVIDDNDVTIAGHPSRYLPGFNVENTLRGHGLSVEVGDGEDLVGLFERMCRAVATPGPVAVINRRPMAPGIVGLEGNAKGHDVISFDVACEYLHARGRTDALRYLEQLEKPHASTTYLGVSETFGSNRNTFGAALADVLAKLPEEERFRDFMVIDNDLEGSTGIAVLREKLPEIYVSGGIMERSNYSAAAGFGFEEGRHGVYATFSAFLEMVTSEIAMARLNESNVLAHFSHAGVDDMADNTCHYGTNIFFADNGPAELSENTRLYFPADVHQMRAVVAAVYRDRGLRFVFSTRSKTPEILGSDGNPLYAPDSGYTFVPGRDELVREGSAGYLVSYGEMLYRALDAVERLRADGIDVGLINKVTLNLPDEDMLARIGATGFVVVAESQHIQTGLGMRFGTWLLERNLRPRYARLGVAKGGAGGLGEHVFHHGLDSDSLQKQARALL